LTLLDPNVRLGQVQDSVARTKAKAAAGHARGGRLPQAGQATGEGRLDLAKLQRKQR
jgi:hypothetical protein